MRGDPQMRNPTAARRGCNSRRLEKQSPAQLKDVRYGETRRYGAGGAERCKRGATRECESRCRRKMQGRGDPVTGHKAGRET